MCSRAVLPRGDLSEWEVSSDVSPGKFSGLERPLNEDWYTDAKSLPGHTSPSQQLCLPIAHGRSAYVGF
jgi:hypothetical protein